MTNCFLDFNNEIKIPQNFKTNITIEKSKIWNYAISISFKLDENIDYVNLYFILKSYALNTIFVVHSIGTSFYDLNDKMIITQKENAGYIKKMNFEVFVDWVNYRIKNDWEYNTSKTFYNFLLFFEKDLITLNNKKYNCEVLLYLKPIYPWSENWLDFFKKSLDYIKFLEKKIIFLENQKKN